MVKDWSRNLVIDVPLPAYAAQFWPPGPGHRWFVEVSDDSDRHPGTDTVGSVREVILVDRTRAAARSGPPFLYRAGARDVSLSKGGKVTVYIPD